MNNNNQYSFGTSSNSNPNGRNGIDVNVNDQNRQFNGGYQNGQRQQGFQGQLITQHNMTNMGTSLSISSGVSIQFQLRGYSNPQFALPGGNTCVCPSTGKCDIFSGNPPRCYFGFTFIISSGDEAEESVRYQATDFVHLDPSGQLPQNQAEKWSKQFVVQMGSKPAAIDVFAHHMGASVSQATGEVVQINGLTHVDTFIVPLKDVLPAIGGVQNMNDQRTYTGKLLGTSLTLSFSISCTGNLIGPNCDLSCNRSSINTNVAACKSEETGFFQVCNYVQTNNQVSRCQNCPWGIRDGTYCQDESGNMLQPKTAGVVDSSYQTATIALGIVCFILFVLLLLACLGICLQKRKMQNKPSGVMSEEKKPLHTTYADGRNLKQPPGHDARPIKPALRRPNYDELVDRTRDSGSDITPPVRPSRSEIV
ncbi:hypothetical protein WR25_15690 [Diploscapter pachys]|uniref:Uncharacterized protein n=1 Tax=Diploscapter pachys TaxID=2018661 RepID=A0A2A2J350_9BILA|nr:hypothetical protein WR25_15690 [Diploscapter pachys]